METEKILKDLANKLAERGEQTKLAEALGIGRATPKRWIEGTEISPAHLKLLKLYLYGEMPFELIRDTLNNSKELEFTEQEWSIITTLSIREGYKTPQAWITAQIRGYLRAITHLENTQQADPTPLAAEPETKYDTQKKSDTGKLA